MGVEIVQARDQRLAASVDPHRAIGGRQVPPHRDDPLALDQHVLHLGWRAGAVEHARAFDQDRRFGLRGGCGTGCQRKRGHQSQKSHEDGGKSVTIAVLVPGCTRCGKVAEGRHAWRLWARQGLICKRELRGGLPRRRGSLG